MCLGNAGPDRSLSCLPTCQLKGSRAAHACQGLAISRAPLAGGCRPSPAMPRVCMQQAHTWGTCLYSSAASTRGLVRSISDLNDLRHVCMSGWWCACSMQYARVIQECADSAAALGPAGTTLLAHCHPADFHAAGLGLSREAPLRAWSAWTRRANRATNAWARAARPASSACCQRCA